MFLITAPIYTDKLGAKINKNTLLCQPPGLHCKYCRSMQDSWSTFPLLSWPHANEVLSCGLITARRKNKRRKKTILFLVLSINLVQVSVETAPVTYPVPMANVLFFQPVFKQTRKVFKCWKIVKIVSNFSIKNWFELSKSKIMNIEI